MQCLPFSHHAQGPHRRPAVCPSQALRATLGGDSVDVAALKAPWLEAVAGVEFAAMEWDSPAHPATPTPHPASVCAFATAGF